MVTLKRSKKVQSIIFPLYRGNGHFGHLGSYPNNQETIFWTFWTSGPGHAHPSIDPWGLPPNKINRPP